VTYLLADTPAYMEEADSMGKVTNTASAADQVKAASIATVNGGSPV
jgi:hypothetical protein